MRTGVVVKIQNFIGSIINPSTEEKQDDIIAVIGGFNIGEYDYVERAWTAGTFTEVWTFYTGGSGGTLVATVTIIYDDESMDNIVSVQKV